MDALIPVAETEPVKAAAKFFQMDQLLLIVIYNILPVNSRKVYSRIVNIYFLRMLKKLLTFGEK